ncbi:MAG: diguanylate cyclase domain-containing protein [Novosphingobium sp.]
MYGARLFILQLVAVLLATFGVAGAAHAEIKVQTCIARIDRTQDPADFDCGKVQNRFGAGDFAADLRFAPIRSDIADPLVLRTSSVWQGAARVIFRYADGSTSETSFAERTSRPFMTIGAIYEWRVPPRDAPLTGVRMEIRDSPNWRGVVIGAHLMTASESYRLQSWLVALYAAFGGLSLALLAYNLSLWTVLRHRFQLSYAAMVGALMAYTFTSSSIAMLVIPTLGNNDRLRLNYIFLALAAVAGIRFMFDFFGEKVTSRRLRRIATVLCCASLTSALAFALLAPWQGYWLDRFYFISGAAAILVIIPIIHAAWRAKVRNLSLFALAWSAPILVTFARVAYGMGWVQYSFWLDNGNLVALSIESVLSIMLIVGRLRDIYAERDEAKASEQLAMRLANSDPLTGLLNRRAFIQHAIGREGEHRLFLIDIDHFKAINDRIGHVAGDDVLREVSAAIQECRPRDSLAVRLGGEEFALLIPVRAQSDCPPDRILAAVRQRAMPMEWQVTVSIGFVDGCVTSEDDWRRLYRLADTALYRAKADGRDRACRATAFASNRAA